MPDFVKILVAGLLAIGAMTLLMLAAPLLGTSPAVGWVMHSLMGLLFTAANAFFFNACLFLSSPVARGAAYGVLVLAQVIFARMRAVGLMPAAGDGLLLGLMGSLRGHLVFGRVGGFFSAQQAPARPTLA